MELQTVIYQLPISQNLNLDYLAMRLVLNGLNKFVSNFGNRSDLYDKVATEMGLSERTLWRMTVKYNINYNTATQKYYILNDNPIISKGKTYLATYKN